MIPWEEAVGYYWRNRRSNKNKFSPRSRHLVVLLLLVASLGVKGILLLVDREILDTTFVLYLLNCGCCLPESPLSVCARPSHPETLLLRCASLPSVNRQIGYVNYGNTRIRKLHTGWCWCPGRSLLCCRVVPTVFVFNYYLPTTRIPFGNSGPYNRSFAF